MKKYIIISLFIYSIASFNFNIDAAPKKNTAKKLTDVEMLELGKEAFLNYDFETASDYYSQYKAAVNKAKKEVTEEFEVLERQLQIAENALERVEIITIIDSISLPRESFYNYYKLPLSAGKISSAKMTDNPEINSDAVIFTNEAGDYMVWAQNIAGDSIGLKEGFRLLDGEWINSDGLNGNFVKSGNYDYPFMSADGQTLYFANDGEGSMGGYDLFVAQRDPVTGEYRQPLNMGMPFNSPYDDIMLAVDEENGIGWWATDRNSEGGDVTVYVYLLNEIRQNYSPDEENLIGFARIDDFRSTQNPDKRQEYNRILKSLPDGNPIQDKVDFNFNIGNGKTYHRLKDFKNRKAAETMTLLLKKEKDLLAKESELKNLRIQYSKKKDKGLETKIIQLEQVRDRLIDEVNSLKKEVYQLERSQR